MGAAAVIAWQPEGVYKYLQTISVYLVMPLTPAIVFGILSKRVTFAGAAASFFSGHRHFRALRHRRPAPEQGRWRPSSSRCSTIRITENYTYRGFWGTLAITLILFAVSAFTKKTDPAKLEATTINWGGMRTLPGPLRLAAAPGGPGSNHRARLLLALASRRKAQPPTSHANSKPFQLTFPQSSPRRTP